MAGRKWKAAASAAALSDRPSPMSASHTGASRFRPSARSDPFAAPPRPLWARALALPASRQDQSAPPPEYEADPTPNPYGGNTGSNRVNRGGSWNNDAGNARSANRNNNDPGNRNDNLSFRLAR
jgi:hypothetical protein